MVNWIESVQYNSKRGKIQQDMIIVIDKEWRLCEIRHDGQIECLPTKTNRIGRISGQCEMSSLSFSFGL